MRTLARHLLAVALAGTALVGCADAQTAETSSQTAEHPPATPASPDETRWADEVCDAFLEPLQRPYPDGLDAAGERRYEADRYHEAAGRLLAALEHLGVPAAPDETSHTGLAVAAGTLAALSASDGPVDELTATQLEGAVEQVFAAPDGRSVEILASTARCAGAPWGVPVATDQELAVSIARTLQLETEAAQASPRDRQLIDELFADLVDAQIVPTETFETDGAVTVTLLGGPTPEPWCVHVPDHHDLGADVTVRQGRC